MQVAKIQTISTSGTKILAEKNLPRGEKIIERKSCLYATKFQKKPVQPRSDGLRIFRIYDSYLTLMIVARLKRGSL